MGEAEEDNLDNVDLILNCIADCVVNCNDGVDCHGDDDYDDELKKDDNASHYDWRTE